MLNNIYLFWRYLKFQLIFKRRFSKTPGIPCLCKNIKHPYHESEFEMETCNVLCAIVGNNEVLVPIQHKCPIKFDFIIKGTAIIEPHGIWTNRPGEDTYFSYYKQRRDYADKYDDLKSLPVVVLSNTSDLHFLINKLKGGSNYKIACQETSAQFLEKYRTNEVPRQQEFVIRLPNVWLIIFLVISILLNVYLIFFIHR